MKRWNNAELVELNITATAEGGQNIQQIDKYWSEKETGDVYASYASGGEESFDPITVIKD